MRKQGWGEGGRGPPLVTSPPHHQGLIVVCDSRALGPTQALEQKNGLGPVTPFTSAHLPGSPQIHAGEIRLCRRTLNSENGGLVFRKEQKSSLYTWSLFPLPSPQFYLLWTCPFFSLPRAASPDWSQPFASPLLPIFLIRASETSF